jgi:hypothetical protein
MAFSTMLDEPSTILHHEVTYPLLSPCETVADGTTTPSDIIYGVPNLPTY